jgi:hypothetical protein
VITARSASEPGSPDTPNEDRALVAGDRLAVLDGLTARTDTGCIHGTPWFVDNLTIALDRLRDLVPPESLRQAIANTAALHQLTCDLAAPATPCAAVGIVDLAPDSLTYLVLGDITVVIRADDEITIITDRRITTSALEERAYADSLPASSPDKPQALRDMKYAELAVRNREGGYWIAGSDPSVVTHAISGHLRLTHPVEVALLTDGAARAVDILHLMDWTTVLNQLRDTGPISLIQAVRQAEATDPNTTRWPRNKPSDDATTIYASLV